METGRENSIPVVKEYQRDGSWVPVTPVKSRSTTLQKICSDRLTNQTAQKKLSESEKTSQGNQLSETNCLESEVLRPCLEISSQDHKVDACCSSKDFININGKINNLDAILPTKSEAQRNSVGFYNNLSNDDEERWQYVSFAQLLALADASTVTLAHAPLQNQVNAARSSFVSFSNPQVAESPLMSTIENPSPTSQDPLLGTQFQPNSSCTSDICHYGHSTSSHPSVELNSPPGAAEAFLSSISPQFAPITPDQAKKTEKGQSSDFQELIVNERVDHSRGSQNGISTEMVTGNDLHQETEQLEQLTDHAVAELPNQLLEIHNPDKGGRQGTETNKTPQQKTRRKRHRPKVVIEGQPKQTRKPRTPKPAPNPQTGKRKYVRRNGLNKSATPTPEITGEITGSKPARKVRKSCRRPLNFDFEYEAREESSSSRPSSNFDYESHEHNYLTRTLSRSTAQVGKGMEETTVKEQVYIDNDISYSENQVLEGSIPKPDKQTPGPTTPSKTIPANKIMIADFHNGVARGKCRITFSEETHDKDISPAQLIKNNVQSLPRNPNDSNYSSNEFFTIAKQTREIKRKHPSMIDEANLFTVNVIESRYPSEHAHTIISPFGEYYSRLPYLQFPTVYKKRRTERGHTSVRCETLSTMTEAENHARQMWPFVDASTVSFTSEISCSIPAAHVNAIPRTEAMQDVQHPLKCVLAFSDKERLTKRRSKGATRLHSLATLTEISKQLPSEIHKFMQGYQSPHQSNTCMEAQARVRMAKGRRTKRKSNINSVPSNCNHQKFLNESIAPPAISQINMSFNAVAEQFEHLNINAQSSQAPFEESNELVPYNQSFNGGTSLALYQMNGTLVPFEGSFDQVRKKRPRPKVELDDETNRVWKLLLQDINSKGIDGTDQEKAKWWEEERRVFRGRADSFIARMHLIQGDRRFSQWKGSVVDSVVGVFLTQNVSDHLSSSAFMSLAAHFPLKPKSANGQPHEERASISVCILDADDTVEWHEEQPNQPPFEQSFLKLQNMKYREEMEVSNQNIYVEGRCNEFKAPDNSRCELLDSSKSSPEMYSQSAANTSGTHTTEVDTITIENQSEMEDALSSQNSVVSCQNSMNLSFAQTDEKICSCSQNNLEAEQPAWSTTSDGFGGSTSFVELLHRAGSIMYNGVYDHMNVNMLSTKSGYCQSKGMPFVLPKQDKNQLDNVSASSKLNMPSSCYQPNVTLDSGVHELGCLEMLKEENCISEQSALSVESVSQARVKEMKTISSQERPKTPNGNNLRNNYQVEVNKVSTSLNIVEHSKNDIELQSQGCVHEVQQVFKTLVNSETLDVGRTTSVLHNARETKNMLVGQSLNDLFGMNTGTSKPRRGRKGKEKQSTIDWDILRKQAQANGRKREKTENTMDSLDWEAVRQADVNEIAKTIKERGMNNVLAERIKDFLNRLVRDHGSVDIEWLRDVPPDKAKEYLLSIRGLGLKSVECVRLLTLQHLAFPVDTNVGRIAVRLGWVPLQPLPESLQLHLLELYPVLESIQKYLWPRLCKLDQRTLYELHYQMITFGKVFCTKSKPNCNACPMRGECRHFASAFASARLALPAPEDKSIVSRTETKVVDQSPVGIIHPLQLPLPQSNKQQELLVRNSDPIVEVPTTPEPIVEVPGTPEPEHTLILKSDIEEAICEDPDEIPTIKLNMVEFTQNLQNYMQKNMEIQEGDTSKALVSLTPEAASIPTPKLKNVSQLRTEHRVYELPDSHPLLEGLDRREPDDPSPYLLAIWTPGETADSIQPPEIRCNFQDFGELCVEKTCFSCNSIREAKYQTVRGTLLIPCRTAMRGSFPLNGTYFQVNEVFADHESSLNPIHVPRDWLWNLPRRTVYFGTSIPTIFKGLSTDGIQYCFWRGFVCVRGFDQKTRAPRPLIARLHFPASKLTKARGSTDEN